MNFHVVDVSGNTKVGPIPVTTSGRETCPTDCPLYDFCYASTGRLSIHWRKVSDGERAISYEQMLAKIKGYPRGQLIRGNQAGDLPGYGNEIDVDMMKDLIVATRGKRFFTYTHKPVLGDDAVSLANRAIVAEANRAGTVVNLSADTIDEADRLAALNIGPVVTLLPKGTARHTKTPEGRSVILCPYQYADHVTCATCGLCAAGKRKSIIGFEAHGTHANKVHAVALGGTYAG